MYQPTRKVPCRAFQTSIKALLCSQLCIIYAYEKQEGGEKRERKEGDRHRMAQEFPLAPTKTKIPTKYKN